MPPLDIEFEAYNGYQHLSQEDFWILPMDCLMLVIFVYMLGKSFFHMLAQFKKDEMAESPTTFLTFICLLEIGQIVFDIIHMYSMKEYGYGIFVFDIMNNVLALSS
jgi:hypothetical protein